MVDWGYTDEKKGNPVTATEASLLRITKQFPKQKVSRDSQTCKIASFIVILSVLVNNRRNTRNNPVFLELSERKRGGDPARI